MTKLCVTQSENLHFPMVRKTLYQKKKKKPEKQLSLCFSTTMLKSKILHKLQRRKRRNQQRFLVLIFPDSYSTLVFNHSSVNSQQCYTYLWIYLVGVNTTCDLNSWATNSSYLKTSLDKRKQLGDAILFLICC